MRFAYAVPLTLLVLAAPATASAQSALTTDKACYVENDPVVVTGTGYTPGANYFLEGQAVYAPGTVNPDGTFQTTIRAPINPNENTGVMGRLVNGYEEVPGSSNVVRATTTLKIVSLYVKLAKSAGNPEGFTKWSFSGFAPHKKIYIHHKRGHHVWTAKAGRAKGPCGQLQKVRLRRFAGVPGSAIHSGSYKLRIDNNKHWLKNPKGRTISSTSTVF